MSLSNHCLPTIVVTGSSRFPKITSVTWTITLA